MVEPPVKLIVVGDSGVGKTCILQKFTERVFSDGHKATIGVDFKVKYIDVCGKKTPVQIVSGLQCSTRLTEY
jgi:GTPase SAR1 family protein